MLTTALIVLSALIGQADDVPENVELRTKVTRLVRQLGSSQLADRDEAEAALIALGPAAIDVIDNIPASSLNGAELKSRLARVRDALYQQAVEAVTLATTVTLAAEGMPLSEVLSEIEKQTGNRIADKRADFGQRVTDPKITLAVEGVPYWQALDKVLDQAEMTTYNYSGEKNATSIVGRQEELSPRAETAAYSGVFRFEPVQVEAIRDLRNPANKVLKLFLEVAWEPRMMPIVVAQPLDAFTLTDEDGNAIEVDGQLGTVEVTVNSEMSAAELEIPLILPPRDVEKIAKLEGTLSALVPGRVETFKFDNLAKAKDTEQRRAGATVVLQEVRKNGDVYEVRIVLRFDKAANALESHRGWVEANEVYMLNPAGERNDPAGYSTTRQTPTEIGFAYQFAVEGKLDGHSFVYKTPAAIVEKAVKYELKDILLP
jgi:hypothetical protein